MTAFCHGHAVAALCYGVMGSPRASEAPEDQPPDDPRAAFLWKVEPEARRALREQVAADGGG